MLVLTFLTNILPVRLQKIQVYILGEELKLGTWAVVVIVGDIWVRRYRSPNLASLKS
jgi:hypothetical protein